MAAGVGVTEVGGADMVAGVVTLVGAVTAAGVMVAGAATGVIGAMKIRQHIASRLIRTAFIFTILPQSYISSLYPVTCISQPPLTFSLNRFRLLHKY